MYKITQALTDLKHYYGLKDFHEVILNMEDIEKPFISFKTDRNEEWIITLKRNIHEEGENGVL